MSSSSVLVPSSEKSVPVLSFIDASLSSSVKSAAPLLGVEPSRSWNCIDDNEDLELFHYNSESVPVNIESVRGVVIDQKEGTIVARSYNYTPTVVCDELKLTDGKLELVDTDEQKYSFTEGSFYLRKGYEGTIMRVFKHKGKVYHASHRRLDTTRSRWGKSPPFLDIYRELGGPSDETLFSPDKDYSPYCYVFLMVHPTLLMCSQQDVGTGYLIYLGSLKLWENKYPQENVDTELHTFPTVDTIPEEITEPFILTPPEITMEEANKHLKEGWTGNGEFVILYQRDGTEGTMPTLLKISSQAYVKRNELRNNDSNIYHRFVELSSQASNTNKDSFTLMYSTPEKTTLLQRYEAILSRFRTCLPLHCQEETKDFIEKIYKDRNDLAYWITGLIINGYSFTGMKVPPRLFTYINTQRGLRNDPQQVRKNVTAMLIKEQGASFYKILRFMRNYKHQEEKSKLQAQKK